MSIFIWNCFDTSGLDGDDLVAIFAFAILQFAHIDALLIFLLACFEMDVTHL